MIYIPPDIQHFADIGRLSASLVHEISNPLTAAMLNLELDDQCSPAIRKAKRNMKLLRRYVEAARLQICACSQPTIFSPQSQINQLKQLLLPLARQVGVLLTFGPTPANCKMYGDAVKFQHIVSNLVTNAIQSYEGVDAASDAPTVEVSMTRQQDWLTLKVTDWGKTITAPELSKLFEPFYTTKNQNGHGLGIGLAMVKQSVGEDFGGTIGVRSSLQHGTRFTVKLPLTPR